MVRTSQWQGRLTPSCRTEPFLPPPPPQFKRRNGIGTLVSKPTRTFSCVTNSYVLQHKNVFLHEFCILGTYLETCRETSVYTFSSTSVKINTNCPEPSLELFKKHFTKLTIQVVVRPGDIETQQEMIENRRQVKEQHRGHDTRRKFQTVNRKTMSLFVSDNSTTPWMFHLVCYGCFALLGLSLPYRWYLYCSVGHIRFHIEKRVLREEQLPTVPNPSLGEPSTGALPPDSEAPQNQYPLQPTPPETLPPAYEITCPQFKKYTPKRVDRFRMCTE